MKLETLKAIITDLHLAGIYDIPANDFMDQEKIESQELLKSLFNDEDTSQINVIFNNDIFDERSIADETAMLFSAFGSGKVPDMSNLEVISARAPKATTTVRAKGNIIDPRLNKQNSQEPSNLKDFTFNQATKAPAIVIDFKAEDYINAKIVEDSKFILLLPYKNEEALKTKPDFILLENILKTIDENYDSTSVIFIDDSYKIATQGDAKHIENLAKKLEETLKCNKEKIILSFGQDCLSLAQPGTSAIREATNKVFDVFENKKLLANYSLSAMVNTPKYKSTTWTNILLIKRI